jgi:hypothetical protein
LDLIVGGGKYGCRAVEFLREKHKSFIVIDPNPACQAVERFNLKTPTSLPCEGEHFLHGGLAKAVELIDALKPEYVFPTAPVHIAADMTQIKFELTPWIEPINGIQERLPPSVVLFVGEGKLIASFNRGRECREKCSMPEVCPTTRIRKPCTMTRLMQYASPEAFILISHPMAPGMGALKGEELVEFFNWAENKEKFVVGTSCDCHGVFSAYQKT